MCRPLAAIDGPRKGDTPSPVSAEPDRSGRVVVRRLSVLRICVGSYSVAPSGKKRLGQIGLCKHS